MSLLQSLATDADSDADESETYELTRFFKTPISFQKWKIPLGLYLRKTDICNDFSKLKAFIYQYVLKLKL